MMGDPPRRRRLSDEEHVLWRGVMRSVAPLKRRAAAAAAAPPDVAAADRKPKAKLSSAPPARAQAPAASPKPVRPAPTPRAQPPSMMPLDRRLKQRLARGAVEIDARIDLHGRTQSQAHSALLRFLQRAQAEGAKTALVITGKGGAGARSSGEERGVLKRQVPLWLRLPEFRAYVLGVDDAHIGHGGEGALYVRVRRGR
ncbi:MAG: hypothetical protein QOG83_1047 [Alphaproteobacteria bacterium]|nr:hypothetical protein [Alphaproteobacteria bacterium]